jgi:hypothetical protein
MWRLRRKDCYVSYELKVTEKSEPFTRKLEDKNKNIKITIACLLLLQEAFKNFLQLVLFCRIYMHAVDFQIQKGMLLTDKFMIYDTSSTM